MAIYAKSIGASQGAISGSVTTKGFEKQLPVLSLSFGYARPIDAHSGLLTGGIVARPAVMTFPMDPASPLLMNSAFTNEVLTSVAFTYTKDGATSGSVKTVTVTLKNAVIQDYQEACDRGGEAVDTVTLSYQQIEWTWVNGGIVASNDWSTSRV